MISFTLWETEARLNATDMDTDFFVTGVEV